MSQGFPRLKVSRLKTEVKILTAEDIGADKDRCGLKGSPTQVIKTFVPEHNVVSEMIDGSAREQAKKLADKLLNMQFLKVR